MDVRDNLARGKPGRGYVLRMQSGFPRSQSRLLPFDMDPSPLLASHMADLHSPPIPS